VDVTEGQITTSNYGRLDCYVYCSEENTYKAVVQSHHDVPLTQVTSKGPGARSVEAALEELRRALEQH
jgi:hypothetical protein